MSAKLQWKREYSRQRAINYILRNLSRVHAIGASWHIADQLGKIKDAGLYQMKPHQ